MDKIETANWPEGFSHNEQAVLHASERYAEVLVSFKEPGLAAGSSQVITTPHMMLTKFSLNPVRVLNIKDLDGKETAESVFILDGNVESHFPCFKKSLRLKQQQHSMQYNTSFTGDHIIRPGGFTALSITYDTGFLKSVLQSAGSKHLDLIGNSIERKENFLVFPGALHWQPRVADVINAISNCSFHGLTRYIFIESKMMELFALQIEHLSTINPIAKEEWSKADKEKLFAVREYIERSYLEELSFRDIILRFGLNEYKLKKGYKHYFSHTVFGHIHQLRMQKAKTLLETGDLNITEVAYYIGYNNVSSFSAEFRKRFGYSPRLIKEKNKGQASF